MAQLQKENNVQTFITDLFIGGTSAAISKTLTMPIEVVNIVKMIPSRLDKTMKYTKKLVSL